VTPEKILSDPLNKRRVVEPVRVSALRLARECDVAECPLVARLTYRFEIYSENRRLLKSRSLRLFRHGLRLASAAIPINLVKAC
jgi:hypothetical protein